MALTRLTRGSTLAPHSSVQREDAAATSAPPLSPASRGWNTNKQRRPHGTYPSDKGKHIGPPLVGPTRGRCGHLRTPSQPCQEGLHPSCRRASLSPGLRPLLRLGLPRKASEEVHELGREVRGGREEEAVGALLNELSDTEHTGRTLQYSTVQ